ncbi:MAG: DUF3784 domain-containing protein [Candidatus Methanomethylophilus sp.]|nr:DUF3784 domain-containing protein [Methanomethylophilus sp.]
MIEGREEQERTLWTAQIITAITLAAVGATVICYEADRYSVSVTPLCISLLMAILLAVIGIVVFPGNGGKILTGYSTMSKEELAKFDVAELSHTAGLGFTMGGIFVWVVGVLCNAADIGDFAITVTSAIVFVLVIAIVLSVATAKAKRTVQ